MAATELGRKPMRVQKKDVFLSHASVDKETFVIPFARQLDRSGISYWLDEAEIRWGDKIARQINRGLNNARFVVIFLSESFVGRNWTEAELSAALARENAEGRTVVLTIVTGNEDKLLSHYPLLRDKKYVRWSEGEETIVGQLQDLIFISEIQPRIDVPIRRTRLRVPISPDLTLKLLDELDPHTVFAPAFICRELEQCGFVASWFETTGNIDINGSPCGQVAPDVGQPGIWALDLARVVFRLVTGKPYIDKRFGRGSTYRVLLRELRDFFVKAAVDRERRGGEQPSPGKGGVAIGKFYSGMEKMGMAAAELGGQITLHGIPKDQDGSKGTLPARRRKRRPAVH